MRYYPQSLLLLACLLSACGGGGSTSSAPTVTPTSAPPTTALQAVQAAPTTIAWNDTVLSAEVYVNPSNFLDTRQPASAIPPGAVIAAGIDISVTPRVLSNGPTLPLAQQAGAFVLLQAAKAGTRIDPARLHQIAVSYGGKLYQLPISYIAGINGETQRLLLAIPNGFEPEQLALQIDNGGAAPVWLAARVHSSQRAFRVYSQGQLTSDLDQPGLFQPILRSQVDNSGMAVAIQTMLLKKDPTAVLAENNVTTGLLKYGETDKILQRQGFSLLDMKRYLAQLNITANAYSLTDIDADISQLRAQGDEPCLMPVLLFGNPEFVLLAGLDSQYLYVASSHFGNLAVPRTELQDVWLRDSNNAPLLMTCRFPIGWTFVAPT